MNPQNLYDLSPALRLMIMGLVVALGPLAWVWVHNKKAPVAQRLRVLTLVTLFLTFDLVIFGAFTRLTDSGLGCPDWPGCYGSASPVGAQMHIEAAQTAMPTGPVTHSKAWIEMIHRYLATGVGVLILTLTVTSWLERKRISTDRRAAPRSDSPLGGQRGTRSDKCGGEVSPWWPTVTLAWVCLQGAFGALTVTMKLFPAIVTLHLLGGLVLLALLRAQAVRYAQVHGASVTILSAGLRRVVVAAFALLWAQIALGGWVSTNYAVLACTNFPACQGSFWPAMDFHQGFTLWRELGAGHDGANISFEALTAIHYVHRLVAYLVFAVFLALAFCLHRVPAFRMPARWLAGLILLQAVTGISNAVLGWPLLAAVMHTGGAAALVIVLSGVVFSSRGEAFAAHASKIDYRLPMNPSTPSAASAPATPHVPSKFAQFYALTKPRVVQLIVFCALIGMVLAVPGVPAWPDVRLALIACAGIWLVAGAAAAFNCLVEQQIDARMRRTAWRPTAKGELSNPLTLAFSAGLCALGSWILYVWVNPLTMWLTFATFIGYAVVYTVILKPMTPQNIVIGGASGAMPPVLGWAAMTGAVGPEALILFLIIFLWTPPHFWALALYRVEDYRKSGLPMLPVTHGNEFTRLQVFLYTLVLFPACLMPFIFKMSGWLYLVAAVVLSIGFSWYGFRLWRNYSDALARKTFRFSLIHLSVLFAALLLDHYLV